MREISVADYFVEFLIAQGVTDVFGYQGGMIAYIFDSLGRYSDRINYHSCATEQGAALAACGYAQASGKLGVAISTSGPGFTNLLTGMANAWFDSVPVMFVSGNVNTKDKKREKPLRQLGFQEIQACEMSRTIAKKTYEIELDTDYKKCFEEAYVTAMSDRKGPVYLDLPINACREHIEMDVTNSITINRCSAETQVDYIIKKLCECKKPVIIAGAGIKQAGCISEFRKLIEMLMIPVITTLPAIDVLPTDSRYTMGYIGGTARREAGIALQNADFVLSMGTRLCSKQIGHNLTLFAPKAKEFIRIDIDKNEFCRKIKDNEKDICADLRLVIQQLIAGISAGRYKAQTDKWINSCNDMRELLMNQDITIMNEFYHELTDMLPDNANIIFDVGKNLIYGGQSSIIKSNTEVYMSAGLGAMGYAIPAAIGVSLGNKNRKTYVFTGDGGAQMNIQELNTIIKSGLKIKIIVLNNNALGNIRSFQKQYLDSRFIATEADKGDYYSCDFSAIARAYGLESNVINIKEIKRYKEQLLSDISGLLEIVYDDCPTLPGIVAGGEFLNEDNGIDSEIISEIKNVIYD